VEGSDVKKVLVAALEVCMRVTQTTAGGLELFINKCDGGL